MEAEPLGRGTESELADFLAGLAIMEHQGLTEAFGHLSARTGSGILMTPARAPGLATDDDLLLLDAGGRVLSGGVRHPPALETPLHLGIYRARPDVGAICRTHSPWAVAWGLRGEAFRPVHGFGLMLGDSVPFHGNGNLIHDAASADAAAASLGESRALFLKGNGLLVVGRSIREAVIRAVYLEDACRAVLRSGAAERLAAFDGPEREARSRWHAAELERAWAYYSLKASTSVPK